MAEVQNTLYFVPMSDEERAGVQERGWQKIMNDKGQQRGKRKSQSELSWESLSGQRQVLFSDYPPLSHDLY